MNISKSSKLIEHIKSVILVVLLIKTILLLYFLWGGTLLQTETRGNEPLHVAVDPVSIFQPDRFEISLGGGTHTVTTDTSEKFALLMSCFRTFSAGRNLIVREIPGGIITHNEIKRRESITAVFEYFLPVSVLVELYGLDRIQGADNIVAISELTHVFGLDDSLFVFDRKSGRAFMIEGTRTECFARMRQAVERPSPAEVYMPVTALAGIQNNTLWPLAPVSNIHDVSFFREDIFAQGNETPSLVKDFFGGTLDFVRRIAEPTGTTKYIYGYAEIVVIVHPSGRLEYIRAISSINRRNTEIGYLEAFEVANSFIAAHGGFSTLEGLELTPYLKEVLPISKDGQNGFRFVLGAKIEGATIHYQRGEAMVIDVLPCGVSHFKRQLINVDLSEVVASKREYRQVFFPILNLIAHNEEYVRDVLIKLNRMDGLDELDFLFTNVTHLSSGYVKIYEIENVLKAAWVLTIAGVDFYFGIESGTPLGYRVR